VFFYPGFDQLNQVTSGQGLLKSSILLGILHCNCIKIVAPNFVSEVTAQGISTYKDITRFRYIQRPKRGEGSKPARGDGVDRLPTIPSIKVILEMMLKNYPGIVAKVF
jgi:hypothetical protein